jgi:hypothetical protein
LTFWTLAIALRMKWTEQRSQVCAEHLTCGLLQALVAIADHELDPAQAVLRQRLEELGPEWLSLGRSDRHAQDLAASVRVRADRYYSRDTHDPPALSRPHVGRIDPHIGPTSLNRT